jgi:hypothetical protein
MGDVILPAQTMASAATDLLAALDEGQRETVRFRLDDDATRADWGYFPRNSHGLALGAMDAKQSKLAHKLIAAGLRLHAYAKVTTIIALDNVLDVIEGRAISAVRDPGRYFLSVYGDPASPPWAWQFEGHHVCLNFTLGAEGIVSPTPLFLGSNPAEIAHGGRPIVRVCGEEEDAGRDLLRSLGAFEQARAIICRVAPPDFILMNAPRVPERMRTGDAPALGPIAAEFAKMSDEHKDKLSFDIAKPLGLPVSKMTPAQRERMLALVDVYVDRLPEELARIERAKIDAAGVEALHFAWAGEDQPRQGHYYRIQGPSLLIEYDNTQGGANHVHAVWRDPSADFGGDILRQHAAAH